LTEQKSFEDLYLSKYLIELTKLITEKNLISGILFWKKWDGFTKRTGVTPKTPIRMQKSVKT